nr:Chain C, E1A heteroclitic Melanoma peptide [synthetic construct]4JFO_F Chain F, E1A heteroclitic Melanoma peptide [synthetic construct]
ALAGIGILTV